MRFDKYGITKSYLQQKGLYILFGTDWLNQVEMDAINTLTSGSSIELYILSGNEIFSNLLPTSLRDAINIESDYVANSKIISFKNVCDIYVSDDRDVFYICAYE